MYRVDRSLVVALLACVGMGRLAAAQEFTVSTFFGNGADIELTENGGPAGAATAGGNGAKINMNARWNFAAVSPSVPDRNEWAAARFDLSAHSDKSIFDNVSLNFYMHRANANNNKSLRFYALAPGTDGENWAEVGTTYETMPGFTYDADSTTNVLDTAGGKIIDLGTFNTTGAETEGALATVTLPALTTLVQGLGTNNLLTIFVTTGISTNGQWRALTKEAAGSETSVISGNVGDFAPFLRLVALEDGGLPGDYNGDGSVDAADYTVWRDHLASGQPLPENDDTPGVDQGDYTRWKQYFGAGGGGGAIVANVPEPTAICLALLLAVCLAGCRRRANESRLRCQ